MIPGMLGSKQVSAMGTGLRPVGRTGHGPELPYPGRY